MINETRINIHDVPTAAQVCEARKVCKMTQAEFGLLIGAHAMSVSKWERGVQIPRDIATRIQRVRLVYALSKTRVFDSEVQRIRAKLAPHDLYAWALLVAVWDGSEEEEDKD